MVIDAITNRTWGYYEVIRDYPGCKLKELIVDPGKSLSNQRHFHRAEIWYVREGSGQILLDGELLELPRGHTQFIPVGSWHKLINNTSLPLHIIEIQHGTVCEEEDIQRQ
jgi:mannose-6-phosphate isomerase-like protein (cupin superfamily)